jgi:hypothetical protein
MSWGKTSLILAGALLMGAAAQAHAATVGLAFNNMSVNLNPDTMTTSYTGEIDFSNRTGTTFAMGGWSPDFGGIMASGFTISGALHFDSGLLDTSASNYIAVDAGNGDLLTLNFGLPATLTALPFNSFAVSVHVDSASISDGNNDGKFGTIVLPYTPYSLAGLSGDAGGTGFEYKFSFYNRPYSGGQIFTVLQTVPVIDNHLDPIGGGPATAPLPMAAWGGMSMLGGLGLLAVRRKRVA